VTTYRVGEAGATVFNEDGEAIANLRPGYVVVEGTIETAIPDRVVVMKRLRNYADKKVRPESDK
jgi:hypothetical protein